MKDEGKDEGGRMRDRSIIKEGFGNGF